MENRPCGIGGNTADNAGLGLDFVGKIGNKHCGVDLNDGRKTAEECQKILFMLIIELTSVNFAYNDFVI